MAINSLGQSVGQPFPSLHAPLPHSQQTNRQVSYNNSMSTSFSLPPLPYDQSALEPYIDAATMKIHHDNHHGTYVSKLNAALADAPASDIFKILKEATASKPAIRNNGSTPATLTIIGGGHYNHTLFWKWMAPVGTANAAPRGALKEAIDKKWGSTDEMRKKFNEAAAGRFGSGWAWLGVTSNGSLEITSTPNQGTRRAS